MIAGGMILKPAESGGSLKRSGQIRCRVGPISEIDRIAGAVFGITRRSRHLGALRSCLIALGFDVEKNTFLQLLRAITAQQSQVNPISCGRPTHRIEGQCCISMQFNASLHRHQLIHKGLRVGEMAQEAAILTRLFVNALNHLDSGPIRKKFRNEQNCRERQREQSSAAEQKPQPTPPPGLGRTSAACDGDVIAAAVTLPAAGDDSPGQKNTSKLFRS